MTQNRIPAHGLLFLMLVLFLAQGAKAQLRVDTDINIQQAISRLVGQGVRVTNVRVNCPSSRSRPYGYFTDNTGTLGISDGLVITTGAATNAVGPNNSASKGQGNSNENQDPDLATIVRGNEKQYDACIIEFDVEVFADTLSFDYVFGSEEYLEFIKEFHDVFGFFISGPGISGKLNLAVIPGTQTPISVANVNSSTNSGFYVDNGTGSTPFENPFVQYDGFTKRLQTRIAVIPCQKYSLKLAICDIKDDIYDAGIFIAGKSLRTKAPRLSVRYQFSRFPTALEGCNGAYVKVQRQSRFQEAITFRLQYSGTATRDLDYGEVPESIDFLPGDTAKEFFVPVLPDDLEEGDEQILVELLNPCPGLPPVDVLTIPIREKYDFALPDARLCEGDRTVLNPQPATGYSYFWSPPDFLSCTECPQPEAFPPFTKRYFVRIRESESGCESGDSVEVVVEPRPTAAFDFTAKPDYTSLDVFFRNLSRGANSFSWTFGDGGSSTEENPSHYYSAGLEMDSISYPVLLYARNAELGCQDSASAVIRIGNPLFIPNLVTDNADGRNDVFFIRGIQPGFWNLEVYNRWGIRVYSEDKYNLDWNGKDLSEGVYFFLLTNPDGKRQYSGWITLVR